jgi:hypothetical protein
MRQGRATPHDDRMFDAVPDAPVNPRAGDSRILNVN